MEASAVSSNSAAVGEFIGRVNAHDPRAIAAFCTPDHVFVDSLGVRLSGLTDIEQAWRGYFSLFPDYLIEVEAMVSRDETVLASGWASATHRGSGLAWRIPCAWRAMVSGGLVAEWQVYADNRPVYEILGHDA